MNGLISGGDLKRGGFNVGFYGIAFQASCCNSPHVIRIPGSVKFSFVKSIILGYEIRNAAQGIRNPTESTGIQTSLTRK